MPDAYPSSAYAKYTLISDQPVLKNNSVSGKETSRKVNGHLHKFNISHPVLTAADYGELDGFLCDKDHVSFTISLPDREPQGVATGTPLVNGETAKGESSIPVDGFTASTTDILKAGDLLTFASHTHVYTALTDIDSDSGGNATIIISPDLKVAILDNEAITVNDAVFTVKLDKAHSSNVAPPILYNFNFNVTEVA